MTQRWMLAALVVMVLVSIGSMGLTWFLVVQAGQVNQALLEQNRAANEIMLTKLAALGNAPVNSEKSMEWNSLKVRLSLEKPGGAPAAGFQIVLQGHILDTGGDASLVRTTGPDGIADFGLVRPGQHLLNVESPSGEILDNASLGSLGDLVTVLPGEPQTVEIVCPPKPEETEVVISVDWPNDLADRPLWLVCDLNLSPRNVGRSRWIRINDSEPQYVAVNPKGELVCLDARYSSGGEDQSSSTKFLFFKDGDSFYADRNLVMRSYVEETRPDAELPGIYRYRNDSDPEAARYLIPGTDEASLAHIWLPKTANISRLKLPAGTFSMTHIAVGLDSNTEEKNLPDDMLHPVFLGGIAVDGSNAALRLLYPNEKQASLKRGRRRKGKIEIPKFEAVAGRLNEWRLTLPQPLVELLQEQPVTRETDADGRFESAPSLRAPQAVPNYGPPSEDEFRRSRRPRSATPETDDSPRAIPVDDAAENKLPFEERRVVPPTESAVRQTDFQQTTKETLDGKNKTTVVYCFTPNAVKSDHESLHIDLATHVADHLNANGIRVVDPDRVYTWLDKHDQWHKWSEITLKNSAIGAAFNADYVVDIQVKKYSLTEANMDNNWKAKLKSADVAPPPSPHHGRTDCSVIVVKMDENKRDGSWIYTASIKSNYPRNGPIDQAAMTDTEFKKRSLSALSDEIGKLFVPTETGDNIPDDAVHE